MGIPDRKGVIVPFWCQVAIWIVCVGCVGSFYFREYGVVKPDNPYLFVGEDLILFCNLTKLELLEDSTYLYFTRNGVTIPAHHVTILTTRSVRLRYPIRSPQDEGNFVCWLRQERGNPRTIGSQFVQADYPAAVVRAINCTVYNWENMTCEWDLGQEYHHPEFIQVSLVWTISGKQMDCPEGHMTDTSCTWVRGSGKGDSFVPGHRYIMSVEVKNTRRNNATFSQTFHIATDTIVKPSPVENLHKSSSNSTCLWLSWNHSDQVHDKVAYVQFLSQWNSSHWHKLDTIFFKRGPGEATICGLTPFTEYTIRVAVKPLPRGSLDGYRSDWRYLEQVRTDPSVPEVSPEMCPGCFTDVFCDAPHCRNVIVYWKHIPWALRRSVIHSYQLTYTAQQPSSESSSVESGNVSTLYPNTSQLLPLRNNSDYRVQLYAVTSDHKVSRNHSALHLVAKKNMPAGPGSFIVETDYKTDGQWTGQFDLRWTDPGQSTASFLVAWCRGSTAVLKCHHEDQNQVQWQEVSSTSRHFQIRMSSQGSDKTDRPNNYIVGVARQTRMPDGGLVSSGLTWAQCYYRKNAVPRALPESVDFSKVFRAGTLRVTWTYRACSNQGGDVYITRFIIYYCVITDTANNRCKGSEFNMTARREARSVLLEDLEQGAYYRVSMAADSQWGTGQRTQPVYSRVMAAQQQEEPRDFTVIGVILAIVIIVVLILIGLCKLRRRIQKSQEKFITSFGDLPSLPPDSAVKSFKDRPLPQVPFGTTASTTSVVYTPNAGTAAGGDKRLRSGKHKSITSETSLLGHEEAGNDDDNKRRHKCANPSTSERSKLLTDDGVTQESSLTVVSKYDSDSGAESRYSGEDHDYASVEGGNGSAEEAGGSRPGTSGNLTVELDDKAGGKVMWNAPQHRPAPVHSPPPPPPSSLQPGYTQAPLVPDQAGDVTAGCAMASFKPQADNQLLLKSFNSLTKPQRTQNPAELAVALEVHSSRTLPTLQNRPPSTGTYPGSEDVTLPRRLPGSKTKNYIPTVQDTPFTNVDPYASTSVTSFSSHLPPPPAPPPYREGMDGHKTAGARGPALNATQLCNGVSEEGKGNSDRRSRGAEPIYSPPWESTSLVPFSVDNRPLSEYMLKLPHNFFDSTLHVNEGPTTEL